MTERLFRRSQFPPESQSNPDRNAGSLAHRARSTDSSSLTRVESFTPRRRCSVAFARQRPPSWGNGCAGPGRRGCRLVGPQRLASRNARPRFGDFRIRPSRLQTLARRDKICLGFRDLGAACSYLRLPEPATADDFTMRCKVQGVSPPPCARPPGRLDQPAGQLATCRLLLPRLRSPLSTSQPGVGARVFRALSAMIPGAVR